MRIIVEKQTDSETRETWYFNTFDLNIVFIFWSKEVKPKGKRKWTIEKYWDKYSRRDYKMVDEPILTELIRNEALSEAFKNIRVLTWSEYKPNN